MKLAASNVFLLIGDVDGTMVVFGGVDAVLWVVDEAGTVEPLVTTAGTEVDTVVVVPFVVGSAVVFAVVGATVLGSRQAVTLQLASDESFVHFFVSLLQVTHVQFVRFKHEAQVSAASQGPAAAAPVTPHSSRSSPGRSSRSRCGGAPRTFIMPALVCCSPAAVSSPSSQSLRGSLRSRDPARCGFPGSGNVTRCLRS